MNEINKLETLGGCTTGNGTGYRDTASSFDKELPGVTVTAVSKPQVFQGRKVLRTMVFDGKNIIHSKDGTFEALYQAKVWLHENGYDCGTTCAYNPIGFIKNEKNQDKNIGKWPNLSYEQRQQMDGVIISKDGSFRSEELRLLFFT